MARILFAWELGGGIGYVDRLSQVAERLEALGHEPVFVIRDLIGTAGFFANRTWIVLQSPLAVGQLHPTQPSFVPGSYADLIAVNNFTDAEQLYRLVHAWHVLFQALQPAAIVAEYAPTVALAAHGRIPVIAMGHGYILPPAETPDFPVFDPAVQRFAPQEKLFETVLAVQRRLRAPEPASVPQAVTGSHSFVTAFRETDPYAGFRQRANVGPLETYAPPVPPAGDPSVYAYLSATHPQLRTMLQALVESGMPASTYIKRLTPEMRQYLTERRVKVYDTPPPLQETVRAAHVVIHHGGAATLATAMGAGRPQLLWPEVADQQVSAGTIDRLGVSVNARRRVSSAAQAIRALRELAQGDAPARAMALAQDIQRRREFGSLETILDTTAGLLP